MRATPLRAQLTTAWQATTARMWSGRGGCAQPATSGRTHASSETVSGTLGLVARRRPSVDVSGAIAAGEPGCGGDRWSGVAAVRATFGSPAFRVWVGYSASLPGSLDTAVRLPGPSAGIARRIGGAVLAMSLGPRRDRTSTERVIVSTRHLFPEKLFALPGTTVSQETLYVADTLTRPGTRRVPDLGLALSWTHRAVGIDAAAHVAFGSEMQRADPFARLQLTYALGSRLAALAGVVSFSAVPSLDIPARQVATVGLRIVGSRPGRAAPARASTGALASEFRAERNDDDGEISLAIRAAGAQRVQVAGDFTNWAALDLQRATPDGWWRARVRAEPGLHRLSVRVDAGGWRAPPGLPPVDDEFGATVGLLILP